MAERRRAPSSPSTRIWCESTLAFMQELTARGLMPKAADYAGAQTFMFTGKAGFYMQGEWEITTAQSIKGLDFGMTPIPTLFDKPATQADSHTFVLPKMDRNEDQMQRAMGFIKSMLDQGLTWAEGGHVLAYLPTLESPEVQGAEPAGGLRLGGGRAPPTTTRPGTPARGRTSRTWSAPRSDWSCRASPAPRARSRSMRAQLTNYANTADPL